MALLLFRHLDPTLPHPLLAGCLPMGSDPCIGRRRGIGFWVKGSTHITECIIPNKHNVIARSVLVLATKQSPA